MRLPMPDPEEARRLTRELLDRIVRDRRSARVPWQLPLRAEAKAAYRRRLTGRRLRLAQLAPCPKWGGEAPPTPGWADRLVRYEPPSGQHRLGTAQGGGRTQLGIPALQSNCPCILATPEVFA
jgi:hypothetical protein